METSSKMGDTALCDAGSVLDELWASHDALVLQHEALEQRANKVYHERQEIDKKIKELGSGIILQYARQYCQELTQKVSARFPREIRNMIHAELLSSEMGIRTYYVEIGAREQPWERKSKPLDPCVRIPDQFTRPDFSCPQFRRELAEFYYSHMEFNLSDSSRGPELLQKDLFHCGCHPGSLIQKLRLNLVDDLDTSITRVGKLLESLLRTGVKEGRVLSIWCGHSISGKEHRIRRLISEFGPALRQLQEMGFAIKIWPNRDLKVMLQDAQPSEDMSMVH